MNAYLCELPRRVGCHAQEVIPIWQHEVIPARAPRMSVDSLAFWRAERLWVQWHIKAEHQLPYSVLNSDTDTGNLLAAYD